MTTRINRKKLPEWQILDLLLLLGAITYIIAQYVKIGCVRDFLFIALLTGSTVFVNSRQVNLYQTLTSTEATQIFNKMYSPNEYEKQIKSIFDGAFDTGIAILFAVVFVAVMNGVFVRESVLVIKVALLFFFFMANIPTGYAILRILKYFLYNIAWIKRLENWEECSNRSTENFLKKVCTKVLFTAATYCTLSLSSILFTDIELNFIVVCYTVFAATLVLTTILSTNILLQRKHHIWKQKMIDKIDSGIALNAKRRIEDEKCNEDEMKKIKELVEIKEYILRQGKGTFDISKFVANIGVLLITIMPVLLQWFLEKVPY